MLTQLIYTSRAISPLSAQELLEILNKSVANNAPAGLTGLLLYRNGTFMQLLEGKRAQVMRAYAKISKDPRHEKMVTHLLTPASRREFANWYMGFCEVDNELVASTPFYAPFFEHGFDAALLAAKPGVCMEIMMAIAGLPDCAAKIAA